MQAQEDEGDLRGLKCEEIEQRAKRIGDKEEEIEISSSPETEDRAKKGRHRKVVRKRRAGINKQKQ